MTWILVSKMQGVSWIFLAAVPSRRGATSAAGTAQRGGKGLHEGFLCRCFFWGILLLEIYGLINLIKWNWIRFTKVLGMKWIRSFSIGFELLTF